MLYGTGWTASASGLVPGSLQRCEISPASRPAASGWPRLAYRLDMAEQKRQLAAPGRIHCHFSRCQPDAGCSTATVSYLTQGAEQYVSLETETGAILRRALVYLHASAAVALGQ